MDYFLRKADYDSLITQEKLNVVIDSDDTVRTKAEMATEKEIKSYLRQRYDVGRVFAPLQDWLAATTYYWGDRVYLTATNFSAATAYSTNDRVLYNGNVYYSTAGSTAHAFDVSEWTLIAAEGHYQMMAADWDEDTAYVTGNTVRVITSETSLIYYKALSNNTDKNPADHPDIWEVIESQSGQLLSNANYWVAGDSRDDLILMHYIDIVLYHLHSRINPRNIPEFRIVRKDEAITYLKMIARGTVSADLELLYPDQGNNISFGSNPKNNNFY